jgi:hypothetical protein
MHVRMARELGMNPKKLGEIVRRGRAPGNAPLPVSIQQRYFKRFGKHRPDGCTTDNFPTLRQMERHHIQWALNITSYLKG